MATAYTTDTSTKVMTASQPNSMPACHLHNTSNNLWDQCFAHARGIPEEKKLRTLFREVSFPLVFLWRTHSLSLPFTNACCTDSNVQVLLHVHTTSDVLTWRPVSNLNGRFGYDASKLHTPLSEAALCKLSRQLQTLVDTIC